MEIYIATITTTGLSYIGKTGMNTNSRMKRHLKLSMAEKGSKYWHLKHHFHHSIRKHGGVQKVVYAMLQGGIKDWRQLAAKQVMYIRLFNTFHNGYNQTQGGDGCRHPHSQHTKKYFSQLYKGSGNPFYNKKHTDQTRKKMRQNHADLKGQKSPMWGKSVSEQTKRKMRQNHADFSGQKGPFYGKHHTQQFKKYLSDLNKGKVLGPQSPQHKRKRIRKLVGVPHTWQRKRRVSEGLKAYWHRIKARRNVQSNDIVLSK